MPETNIIFATQFDIPKRTREECNLPKDKFIYCNFAQPYRINKETFAMWAMILQQTPNSILWLHAYNEIQKRNLIANADLYGIAQERLFFSNHLLLTDNWHHQVADVWLDTTHISSGTGILLSLLADLPAITLTGNTAQARTASSILISCNLNDLVCNTQKEYINLAVFLYNDGDKLSQIKYKIHQTKDSMPMFQPQRFIHSLEETYLTMIDNHYNLNKHADIITK